MIPADTNDIAKDYQILLNELKKHNPELLDKRRLLAITKSDMLDDELMEAMRKEVPKDIPSLFISSATHYGITELKDKIWQAIHQI
ncbi:MAG: GTPase ObgE [Bacteroidota bacterium]|jgi:GTP-binding protein